MGVLNEKRCKIREVMSTSGYSRHSMKNNYNRSIKKMLKLRDEIIRVNEETHQTMDDLTDSMAALETPTKEHIDQFAKASKKLLAKQVRLVEKFTEVQTDLEKLHVIYTELAHNRMAIHSVSPKYSTLRSTRRLRDMASI